MTTAIAHWTLADYHRMIETGFSLPRSKRIEPERQSKHFKAPARNKNLWFPSSAGEPLF